MLLYIEACRAGSMFDGILAEDTDSKFYIRKHLHYIINIP